MRKVLVNLFIVDPGTRIVGRPLHLGLEPRFMALLLSMLVTRMERNGKTGTIATLAIMRSSARLGKPKDRRYAARECRMEYYVAGRNLVLVVAVDAGKALGVDAQYIGRWSIGASCCNRLPVAAGRRAQRKTALQRRAKRSRRGSTKVGDGGTAMEAISQIEIRMRPLARSWHLECVA